MRTLQKTYYRCNILFIVLLLVAAGCARRPSHRPPEGPAGARPGILPGVPGVAEPVIRIGLKTDARSVTAESDRGLYVSEGTQTFAAGSRVVIAPAFLAAVTLQYSVQVESFSSRENAEKSKSTLSGKTRRPVFIYHNVDRSLYQIRVGPMSSKEEAQNAVEEMKRLAYSSAFYVSDESGQQGRRAELVVKDDSGTVLMRTHSAVQIWNDDLRMSIDQESYRGYAKVFVNDLGRLTVVNLLNYEEYLKGVVPNEIGGGSNDTFEALKAQAVAARTYAYKNRGQFEKDGYDLCATPRCQVYSGMKNESPLTTRAIEETKGEILTHSGEPINALYTSTCGGRTENAEFMFENMNFPYLKSVPCYPEEGSAIPSPAKLEGSAQPWWLAWLNAKTGIRYGGDMNLQLQRDEAVAAVSHVIEFLGKTACAGPDLADTNWVTTGQHLVSRLCWQARRDSLLTEKDYQYFLSHLSFSIDPKPETHSFLFLFHDNILVPEAPSLNRFNPYSPIKRQDFYRALFQILDHYRQINPEKGQAREVRSNEVQVVDERGVHLYQLHSPVFLFQMLNDSYVPREDLACSPGDRVEYFVHEGRISILACELSQKGASVDRSSKYSFWKESVTPADLGQRVSKYTDVGDVLDLQPLTFGASGRIYELKVTGTRNTAIFSGIRVRWALGLKDNLFTIDRSHARDGKVREYVFTGRGWGHGVGMCQVGALGYARRGKDYVQILQHYYTGTQISSMW